MASGDTRTQQYLGIAANGNRADLPGETCCETRTQALTREVAERIIGLDEEVRELKNNPDVVDVVETHQDLEDYDTSTLTDKDIIRVLQDSTHSGNSTYYRWNSATEEFDFVGEISSGGESGTTLYSNFHAASEGAISASLYTDSTLQNKVTLGGMANLPSPITIVCNYDGTRFTIREIADYYDPEFEHARKLFASVYEFDFNVVVVEYDASGQDTSDTFAITVSRTIVSL